MYAMSKRFEDEIEHILELSPDLPDGLNLSGLSLSEKISSLWTYFINREIGILSSKKIILAAAISIVLYLVTKVMLFFWFSVFLLTVLYTIVVFSFRSLNRVMRRIRKLKNRVI